MWLSLTSLKISLSGARLSHLVQKDKAWDHGSMVEQVKSIFCQMQKALTRNNPELIRKYLTLAGYKRLTAQPNIVIGNEWMMNTNLLEVNIVGVHPGNNNKPDQFSALLKTKSSVDENEWTDGYTKKKSKLHFEGHWRLVRQGEWWLLDDIFCKKYLQYQWFPFSIRKKSFNHN